MTDVVTGSVFGHKRIWTVEVMVWGWVGTLVFGVCM